MIESLVFVFCGFFAFLIIKEIFTSYKEKEEDIFKYFLPCIFP